MTFADNMTLKEVQNKNEFLEWVAGQIGGKYYENSFWEPFPYVYFGDNNSFLKLVFVPNVKQFRYDFCINEKLESYDRVIGDESEIGALIGFMNNRIQVIKDTLVEKKEEEIAEDFK